MKRNIFSAVFLMFAFNYGLAQSIASTLTNDEKRVKSVIRIMFDGLAERDVSKILSCTTSDFHLLENGAVWNNDTLTLRINKSKERFKSFKRTNSFEFIRVNVQGNNAWASFYNSADILMDGQSRKVKWLESAVLIREGESWKVQMFHSTILKEEKSSQ